MELAGGNREQYVTQLLTTEVTPPMSAEYVALALAALRRDPALRPAAADLARWLHKARPVPTPIPPAHGVELPPPHTPAPHPDAAGSAPPPAPPSVSSHADAPPMSSPSFLPADAASTPLPLTTTPVPLSELPTDPSQPPPLPAAPPPAAAVASGEEELLAAMRRREAEADTGVSFDEAVQRYLSSNEWRAAMQGGRGATVLAAVANACVCDPAWAALVDGLTRVVTSAACRAVMGVEGVRDALFRVGVGAKSEFALSAVARAVSEMVGVESAVGRAVSEMVDVEGNIRLLACVGVRDVLVGVAERSRSSDVRECACRTLFAFSDHAPMLLADESVRDVLLQVVASCTEVRRMNVIALGFVMKVALAEASRGHFRPVFAVPPVRDMLVACTWAVEIGVVKQFGAAALAALTRSDRGRELLATAEVRDVLVHVSSVYDVASTATVVLCALNSIGSCDRGRWVLATAEVREVLVRYGRRGVSSEADAHVASTVEQIVRCDAGIRVMRSDDVRDMLVQLASREAFPHKEAVAEMLEVLT